MIIASLRKLFTARSHIDCDCHRPRVRYTPPGDRPAAGSAGEHEWPLPRGGRPNRVPDDGSPNRKVRGEKGTG